jgi:predicted RNA-binding protein YlqC (UPF0109 family)
VLAEEMGPEVVREELAAGSTALLVSVSGIVVPPGTFEGRDLTAGWPVHRLYLRDPHRAGFMLGVPGVGDLAAFGKRLRRYRRDVGAERVVTTGASAGGFSAIVIGLLMNADEVHAFAPVTFFDAENRARYGDRRWQRLLDNRRTETEAVHGELGADAPRDLKVVLEALERAPEIHIHVAENDRMDMVHAEHVEGVRHVNVHRYDFGGHRLIGALHAERRYQPILRGALGLPEPEARTPGAIGAARIVVGDGPAPLVAETTAAIDGLVDGDERATVEELRSAPDEHRPAAWVRAGLRWDVGAWQLLGDSLMDNELLVLRPQVGHANGRLAPGAPARLDEVLGDPRGPAGFIAAGRLVAQAGPPDPEFGRLMAWEWLIRLAVVANGTLRVVMGNGFVISEDSMGRLDHEALAAERESEGFTPEEIRMDLADFDRETVTLHTEVVRRHRELFAGRVGRILPAIERRMVLAERAARREVHAAYDQGAEDRETIVAMRAALDRAQAQLDAALEQARLARSPYRRRRRAPAD